MSFDWNQARAFIATAETGSFSGAARALHQTQPTIGRQVAALEEAMNVVLFERVGRKLIITPAGQDILEHLRDMSDAAMRAEMTASGRSQAISGEVCVSVTDLFAAYVMPSLVLGMRDLFPQIKIEVLASNSLSDLQRHEADIAVRHVRPTQPDLIARKVRESDGRLFANKKYLEKLGALATKDDLKRAEYIGMGTVEESVGFMKHWEIEVDETHLRTRSGSGVASWEMARAGLGIMPMSSDLAALFPEMVDIPIANLEPVEVPYWLTTHRELHSSRRIRLVFDYLAEALAQPDLPSVAYGRSATVAGSKSNPAMQAQFA